jgi:hypothetical protein
MKDRVGTEVLSNGARRYANYNSEGVLQGYMYLLLADEPTEVGTALNKANLLSDATATALGLSGDPTVNDAFAKLVHTTSVTIQSSGWSATAPYTNTVTVSGMTAAMNVEYALDPTATTEAVAEAYGYISSMETQAGQVVFKCNADKPTVNIPIVLKGV